MNRVVIIGGGFAGLSAALVLRRECPGLSVTVADKNRHACFLPLLPDCIGRAVAPELLLYSLEDLAQRRRFRFLEREISAVDVAAGRVFAGTEMLPFDYLLFAAGMQPNFYGNASVAEHGYCLATIDDVQRLQRAVAQRRPAHIVVAGGGYTGVEIVTALWRLCRRMSWPSRLSLVERAEEILLSLPAAARNYVRENLRRMNIETQCGASVAVADSRTVTLSNNRVFSDAVLVWTAGVQTVPCAQSLPGQKTPQGRVVVDDFLRCAPRCFVAGDAAFQTVGGAGVRMSVQAALTQGAAAARNIIAVWRKRPLRRCRPRDLGWVVPMANNHAWGVVCGLPIRGRMAILLHYVMCFYRRRGGAAGAVSLARALWKG